MQYECDVVLCYIGASRGASPELRHSVHGSFGNSPFEGKEPALLRSLEISLTPVSKSKSTVVRFSVLLGAGVVKSSSSEGLLDTVGRSSSGGLMKTR